MQFVEGEGTKKKQFKVMQIDAFIKFFIFKQFQIKKKTHNSSPFSRSIFPLHNGTRKIRAIKISTFVICNKKTQELVIFCFFILLQ